jgi:hypothetical protein
LYNNLLKIRVYFVKMVFYMADKAPVSRAERRTYFNKRNLARVAGGLAFILCGLGVGDVAFIDTAQQTAVSAENRLERAFLPSTARQPVAQAIHEAPPRQPQAITEAATPQHIIKPGRWRNAVQQIRTAAEGPIGLAGLGLGFAFAALAGIGRLAGRTEREIATYAEDQVSFWSDPKQIDEFSHRAKAAASWAQFGRELQELDVALDYSVAQTAHANREARQRSPLNATHAQVLGELGMNPQRALTYHA